LATSNDVEVVGEASNGQEALEQLNVLEPDVVLMDISMPVMGGLEAARRMRRENPNVRLLAVSQHKESEYVVSMLGAGVVGFIPKMAPASDLLAAIKTVYGGQVYLHSSISGSVLNAFRATSSGNGGPDGCLTERELDVLALMAQGRDSRQIAEALSITVGTVFKYQANCKAKLGLPSRAALVAYALSNPRPAAPDEPRPEIHST
jgi:DNA-binding NarL/FixJ family response regulator